MTAPRTSTLPRGTAVSVIVPVVERPMPLADLYREFAQPLLEEGRPFEFVFVVESWRRDRTTELRDMIEGGAPIRILEVGSTAPQSGLVDLAVTHARYPILVVLPPYPRIAAPGLRPLIRAVEDGVELATARRSPREDHWLNRLQAWVLHFLLRRTVWVRFRDIGSGVRAMRREVLEEIALYADFARFLPILAVRAGFRVDEVAVPQHPSDHGLRVYGPGTYLRRLVDLVGLAFLVRFTRKPLRFFGLIGAGLAGVGSVLLVVLALQRLAGQPLADRPALLLAVLLVVLGTQSLGLGLIGELIVHFRAMERRGYRLVSTSEDEGIDAAPGSGGGPGVGGLWRSHASQFERLGPPLRPSPEDVEVIRAEVERRCRAGHPVRTLVLGVTPELADLVPEVLAVDRSAEMIRCVWPHPGRVVRGAWEHLPLKDASRDLVMCDGGFTLVPFPDGCATLVEEVRRVLAPGGTALLRLFVRPEVPETVDAVLADLRAGRIAGFHAFKWRLAMALPRGADGGVSVSDVWAAWDERGRATLAAATSVEWAPEVVDTIEAYRGGEARLYFPHLDEARALLSASFRVRAVVVPPYELGPRCPTLVLDAAPV